MPIFNIYNHIIIRLFEGYFRYSKRGLKSQKEATKTIIKFFYFNLYLIYGIQLTIRKQF